jgi:hypothetical protein
VSEPTQSVAGDVSNEDLVLAMLQRLGGATRYVDIEELTLALFEVAPARFSWRTRRDLPEREVVRFALVHANQRARREGRRPVTVSRDFSRQWKLTAAGVAEAHVASKKSESALQDGQPIKQTGRSFQRVSQVKKHLLYAAYLEGRLSAALTRTQLADLLVVPPDAPLEVARGRADGMRAAGLDVGDSEVVTFAEAIEREVVSVWQS